MDVLFQAHSGFRYLVLLAAVAIIVYAVVGLAMKRPLDRGALTTFRFFVILLDIQLVLGIATLLTRPYFPALIGHIVLMVAAVAIAHLGAVRAKKAEPPAGFGLILATTLIALALIVGGILAIQRPIV